MRNRHSIRPGSVREAILSLVHEHNNQGLTGHFIDNTLQIGGGSSRRFSSQAITKNLLQLVQEGYHMERRLKRNPESNRMCNYYFIKVEQTVPYVNPLVERLRVIPATDTEFTRVETIARPYGAAPDMSDSVVTEEEDDTTIAEVTIDTLEARVWALIVKHAPTNQVVEAYHEVLSFRQPSN